jgi:diguanylate cyclase
MLICNVIREPMTTSNATKSLKVILGFLTSAHTFAEQLRLKTQALRIKVPGTDEVLDTVTASFGVALAKAGDDVESLLTRADDALYLDKRSGRNRVN